MSPLRTPVVRHEERRELERSRDPSNVRTAGDVESLKRAFADHLQYSQAKDEHSATSLDRYYAAAFTVRDRLTRRWLETQQTYYKHDAKRVYYLSLEFLMGRLLENNLINLGLHDNLRTALAELGLDLADLLANEQDAGLGNGGLGRLAACFLDSLATLSTARRTATASATSSASSSRRSATATRWRCRTTGCATATPGRCRARSTWSGAALRPGRARHPTSAASYRGALGG